MSYSLFGKVPDNWTVCKIGDVVSLRQGLQISSKLRNSNFEDGYIPLLKIIDLPNRHFSEYVTNIQEQYIANKDDIIYTRTGQVGLVYTDIEGCVHNNCFKVEYDKSQLDKKYLYYYLNNKYFRELANNVASGSVQKDLTHSAFKILPFAFPKLPIQKKLADILSLLENKIGLNKDSIKTMEELSQILFKYWFNDFEFPDEEGMPYKSSGGKMVDSELGEIPEGWKVVTIGEVCDANKDTLSSSEKWTYINYLDTGNITRNCIDNIQLIDTTKDKTPSRAKRKVQPNDIVYSTVRPNQQHHGIIKEPIENMIASTGFVVLRSKGIYSNDLIYLWLTQEETMKELQAIAEQSTSAYPSIKPGDILSIKILLPMEKQLNELTRIIETQNNLIWFNQQQNKKLMQIRDSLLPKLLSGEIAIPDESVVG
jgi:type I restriction enzyme S subunit